MFLKKFEKVLWKVRFQPFKKGFVTIFDQSKNTFDRSNVTVILTHSGTLFRSIEKNTGSIEMGRGSLKIWEKSLFWKMQTQFWKQLLKAFEQWNQNAWVWDEMLFQKPKILNPIFLKTSFNHPPIQFSQATNMLCTNLKIFSNLVGQTKNTHTSMYSV